MPACEVGLPCHLYCGDHSGDGRGDDHVGDGRDDDGDDRGDDEDHVGDVQEMLITPALIKLCMIPFAQHD